MNKTEMCVAAYEKHKHLKLAGEEIGVPWQTVYVHLRLAGVPVVGDKSRYGSDSDRLAALSETEFAKLVPAARNQNDAIFQPKLDFFVHGYGVDVKASRHKRQSSKAKTLRWAFSLRAAGTHRHQCAERNTGASAGSVRPYTGRAPGENGQ